MTVVQHDFPLHSFPLCDNHSHTQIVKRVPKQARVLELGCGDGSMSQLLREFCQASIVGVDYNAQAVQQARLYCTHVHVADLEQADSLALFEDHAFDVITLVDVLEHLKNPSDLLHRLERLLAPNGRLLLSVPNVAHASVRLELLNGQFEYESSGILDATHLRFFTLRSLHECLQQAGYQVLEVDYTQHDIADMVIARYLQNAGLEPSTQLMAMFHAPDAIAYQFIIAATPVTADSVLHDVSVLFPQASPRLPMKPLAASWETWEYLHNELQRTQAELERVCATRSWRLLRQAANLWRGIQARFTQSC